MTRTGIFAAVAALTISLAPVIQATAQTATPPAPSRPARVRANLSGFDLSPQAGQSPNQAGSGTPSKPVAPRMAPNQIGGASRGLDGSVTLYAPRLGKSYTTRPDFYWSAPADNQKIKFQLMNNAGDVVYEATPTANHLEYPSDASALTPGETYRWTVQLDPNPLDPTSPPASFILLGGSDRTAIAQQLAPISGSTKEDQLARVKVFVDNHVWYDAISAYTALIEQYPNDQTLGDARSAIYEQVAATQSLAAGGSPYAH